MKAKNQAARQAGEGWILGRPVGIQGAKSKSDKGIPRGAPKKK